jgi:glycosyltransferase involved in cell wall biosynthesis
MSRDCSSTLTVLNVAYPLAPVAEDVAGGAEQVLLQLDRALVSAGHRSLVIAGDGSDIDGTLFAVPAAGDVFDDKAKARAQLAHERTLREVLRRRHVDVVHMHGIDFHTYLPPPGVPVLVSLHLPLAWYPQEALRPSRPDTWLHCVGAAQHATRPENTDFLEPIENGVEVRPATTRCAGDYVLFLGRICPEKGVHLALDAAEEAGIPLMIAGAVFPYEEHLNYFAAEIAPRLNSRHRFIGPVGARVKDALLAQARCVVIPSLADETSSLVAREAIAAGTPVIAFRRPALVELIEHGRTGFIVDSVAGMAAAIDAAHCIDAEVCRENARRRFPLSRMIQSYFSVYRQLATARTGAIASPTNIMAHQ